MAEAKLNTDLMQLNQKQLSEHAGRNDIRRQRKEILEEVMAKRDKRATHAGLRRSSLAKWLILLVLMSASAAGYLIYSLSIN